jgi:2-hydroxychromene-2-carboxylate isomerase
MDRRDPAVNPIDFYFDPISPFGYLGSVQIERVAHRLGRTVDWKPVLIGITVLKVMGLKPVPETPLKGPYAHHDALRLAEYFDVPFRYHSFKGINSVVALRSFLHLKNSDPQLAKRFAQRIFRRLWVDGKDITPFDAVAEEANALGADVAALKAAVESADGKDALRRAVDEAIAVGVFGNPYFIVDGEPFWGVDRMWMIEHWARHHTWKT